MSTALHALFGVARDKDIDDIHHTVDDLTLSNNRIKHLVDKSLTGMDTTISDIEQHRVVLNSLIDTSKTIDTRMRNLEDFVSNSLGSVLLPFQQVTTQFMQIHKALASFESSFTTI